MEILKIEKNERWYQFSDMYFRNPFYFTLNQNKSCIDRCFRSLLLHKFKNRNIKTNKYRNRSMNLLFKIVSGTARSFSEVRVCFDTRQIICLSAAIFIVVTAWKVLDTCSYRVNLSIQSEYGKKRAKKISALGHFSHRASFSVI